MPKTCAVIVRGPETLTSKTRPQCVKVNPVTQRRRSTETERVAECCEAKIPIYCVTSPQTIPEIYRNPIPSRPGVRDVSVGLQRGESALDPLYNRKNVWPPIVMRGA